jgi:hypothetical protein
MTQNTNDLEQVFPLPCPECGKVAVQRATIAYDAEVKHDGRLHTFPIPELHVTKCGECGEVLFDSVTDDQISAALRTHLGLLSPVEIRERLNTLGLTQKEFCERARGIAPATLSRWLSGLYIQNRTSDSLMRRVLAEEEAKRDSRKAREVVIPNGELAPWSHSTTRQSEQPKVPQSTAEKEIPIAMPQFYLAREPVPFDIGEIANQGDDLALAA